MPSLFDRARSRLGSKRPLEPDARPLSPTSYQTPKLELSLPQSGFGSPPVTPQPVKELSPDRPSFTSSYVDVRKDELPNGATGPTGPTGVGQGLGLEPAAGIAVRDGVDKATRERLGKAKLSDAQVHRLFGVVNTLLRERGLETLGLFRPHRLAENQALIARLETLFLQAVSPSSFPPKSFANDLPADLFGKAKEPFEEFQDEIKYAGIHDIVAILKWGIRHLSYGKEGFAPISGDSDPWAWYRKFSNEERRRGFSPDAFSSVLLPLLPESRRPLLTDLLNLIASVSALSESNAMSGAQLSKYLGFWLFGSAAKDYKPKNKSTAPWDELYLEWAFASRALEHVFLAYLKEQNHLPTRLAELLVSYETKFGKEVDLDEARKEGAGTILVTSRDQKALRIKLELEIPDEAAAAGSGSTSTDPIKSRSSTSLSRSRSKRGVLPSLNTISPSLGQPTAPGRILAGDLMVAALSSESANKPPLTESAAKEAFDALLNAARAAAEDSGRPNEVDLTKILTDEQVRIIRDVTLSGSLTSTGAKANLARYGSMYSIKSEAAIGSAPQVSPRGRSFSFDAAGLSPLPENQTSDLSSAPSTNPPRAPRTAQSSTAGSRSPFGQFPNKSEASFVSPNWSDFASSGFGPTSIQDELKTLKIPDQFQTGQANESTTEFGSYAPTGPNKIKRVKTGSSGTGRRGASEPASPPSKTTSLPATPATAMTSPGGQGQDAQLLNLAIVSLSFVGVDEAFPDLWLESLSDPGITTTWPSFAVSEIRPSAGLPESVQFLLFDETKTVKAPASPANSIHSVTGSRRREKFGSFGRTTSKRMSTIFGGASGDRSGRSRPGAGVGGLTSASVVDVRESVPELPSPEPVSLPSVPASWGLDESRATDGRKPGQALEAAIAPVPTTTPDLKAEPEPLAEQKRPSVPERNGSLPGKSSEEATRAIGDVGETTPTIGAAEEEEKEVVQEKGLTAPEQETRLSQDTVRANQADASFLASTTAAAGALAGTEAPVEPKEGQVANEAAATATAPAQPEEASVESTLATTESAPIAADTTPAPVEPQIEQTPAPAPVEAVSVPESTPAPVVQEPTPAPPTINTTAPTESSPSHATSAEPTSPSTPKAAPSNLSPPSSPSRKGSKLINKIGGIMRRKSSADVAAANKAKAAGPVKKEKEEKDKVPSVPKVKEEEGKKVEEPVKEKKLQDETMPAGVAAEAPVQTEQPAAVDVGEKAEEPSIEAPASEPKVEDSTPAISNGVEASKEAEAVSAPTTNGVNGVEVAAEKNAIAEVPKEAEAPAKAAETA